MNSNPLTFRFDEENDRLVEEYEAAREQEKKNDLQRLYEKSGVPSKFYNEDINTYIAETEEEKHNKKVVSDFIKAPGNRILILCGKNGNGKSHLGCAALRNIYGLFISSLDLCIEYESAVSFNAPRTRQALLRSLIEPDLVVIDECMKYTTNLELEKFLLSYVGNTRYENNKALIYITNDTKKNFVKFLGKSTFDRLTEVCTTLEFTQESRRREFRK